MIKRTVPGTSAPASTAHAPAGAVQPSIPRQSLPSRAGFVYKPRSLTQIKQRASQRGGGDGPIRADIQLYSMKEGENRFRILPPTWENPDHYGFDVYIHYSVGPDNTQFLCLQRMLNKPDPLCEEHAKAEAAGETEYAKELESGRRVAVWVIDRTNEEDSPMIWLMPWTVDRDICAGQVDPSTGEVIQVDDPDNGFDIAITRRGSGIKTKYEAPIISRRPTPISHDPAKVDKWLSFILKNPIPNTLNYHDYEYITAVFEGASARAAAETTAPASFVNGAAPADDDIRDYPLPKSLTEAPTGAVPPGADTPMQSRLDELRSKVGK